MTVLKVGARGSRLSRAQTQIVVDLLSRRVHGIEIEIVPITTRGDVLPPEKRRQVVDGKTAFTGEIESKLLSGEVDAAVHSMKDMSVKLRDGLKIAATPPRGDPRDALVSETQGDIQGLRSGARVGTSSLRRKAQLLRLRSDLSVVDLSGNVETRIRKMGEFRLDGIVLAAAGLERISESARIAHFFSIDEVIPAVGQGTLAVEIRDGDSETEGVVSGIDDVRTRLESECERAFARKVGGDCYVPVGACARAEDDSLTISAFIASVDGREMVRGKMTSTLSDAEPLGTRLGEDLLHRGGEGILRGLGR